MTDPFDFLKFYQILLVIILIALIMLYHDSNEENKRIKKECVERGYAFYDCDDVGKAVFKFKEKKNE